MTTHSYLAYKMEEWLSNFYNFSPLEESFFGVLSPLPLPSTPPPPPTPTTLYINAYGDAHPPPLMEMPTPMGMTKPHEWTHEKVARYESLINDMEKIVADNSNIEGGRIPTTTNMKGKEKVVQEMGSSPSNEPKTKKNGKPHDKGIPWTRDEHKWFLMGIHKFGKGDWSNISKYYVTSKTPIQIASHAQKYYRRQNCSTRRRRASIHDINTVDPTTFVVSISSFTSTSTALPTIRYGAGAYVLEEKRPLMPGNAFNNNNSFFFPSLGNQ